MNAIDYSALEAALKALSIGFEEQAAQWTLSQLKSIKSDE